MNTTTAALITKAHEQARKIPGYAYNPQTLEAIITAGELPVGVTLATSGDQNLIREGNEILCVKNGQITRRTPLTPASEQQLLVAYAVSASKTPTTMGVM